MYAESFNADISSWNTSSLTDMNYMFHGATSFNQDISDWDVSGIDGFVMVFEDATSFNQDLSGWNTSFATNMNRLFTRALSFDQDISTWDVSNVSSMRDMFLKVSLSTPNYDALLIGWESQDVQDGVELNAGLSTYSAGPAAEARARLVGEHGWEISDGGEAN